MNNEKKKWSDITILKKIKNPTKKKYNIKIVQDPEKGGDPMTFDGVKFQPDFAYLTVDYVPSNYIIELKSYKLYLYQFRRKILSYERLLDVLYNDIMEVYKPSCLSIQMDVNPRGGIKSILTINSTDQTETTKQF